MRYEQIVFDIDGTLINTEYSNMHSLQDILKEHFGKSYEIDELSKYMGMTAPNTLKDLGIKDTDSAVKLWDEKLIEYKGLDKLYDGIYEMLNKLDNLGYKIGIVTSRRRKFYDGDKIIKSIGKYISLSICEEDTAEHKPFGAPLLKYAEVSKCPADKMLYIGDAIFDSKCAENADVDFALAMWDGKEKDIPAKYCLEHPSEIFEIL